MARARPLLRNLQEGGFADYSMGPIGQSLDQARASVGHVEEARRLEALARPLHERFLSAYPTPEGQSPEYALRQRFEGVVSWPVDADLRELGEFLRFFQGYPERAGNRCVEILEARGTNEDAIRGLHEIDSRSPVACGWRSGGPVDRSARLTPRPPADGRAPHAAHPGARRHRAG
ncbi:MAG: hypothetical protein OHK0013_33470 [Sandaracinaceae bacterium]